MSWFTKNVLLTGGASFIGLYLVDAIGKLSTPEQVVDNLSGGSIENLRGLQVGGAIDLIQTDLLKLMIVGFVFDSFQLTRFYNCVPETIALRGQR